MDFTDTESPVTPSSNYRNKRAEDHSSKFTLDSKRGGYLAERARDKRDKSHEGLDSFYIIFIDSVFGANLKNEKRSWSINNGRIQRNDVVTFRQDFNNVSPTNILYNQINRSGNSQTRATSSNYNTNDVVLPAFCSDHPDSKLSYLIQTSDGEVLGWVYCALEQKQADPHSNVVEVKEYLSGLVRKSQEILSNNNSNHKHDTNEICAQIISENDREISLIRQYYNQVIEALTKERDEKINEIGKLTNKNVELVTSPGNGIEYERITNFGIEINKILDSVKDTGIHIKELQRIKYDFDEVVLGKNSQDWYSKNLMINKYEFIMLGQEALKELARKLGSFRIKELPLSYFKSRFNLEDYESSKPKDNSHYSSKFSSSSGSYNKERIKDKKRSSSNNHFKKNCKLSNREDKQMKRAMKENFMNNNQPVLLNTIDPFERNWKSIEVNSRKQ